MGPGGGRGNKKRVHYASSQAPLAITDDIAADAVAAGLDGVDTDTELANMGDGAVGDVATELDVPPDDGSDGGHDETHCIDQHLAMIDNTIEIAGIDVAEPIVPLSPSEAAQLDAIVEETQPPAMDVVVPFGVAAFSFADIPYVTCHDFGPTIG